MVIFTSHMQSYPVFFLVSLSRQIQDMLSFRKHSQEICQMRRYFNEIFWAFHSFIEGFKHCCFIINTDGTNTYGKCKDTLMIVMNCNENDQSFPLAFVIKKE